MTTAMKNKCRALREEVIRLGFTKQQFDAMAKVAYRWDDCHGSWSDAALCVRNTCAYWGTPAAMASSGCHLSKSL